MEKTNMELSENVKQYYSILKRYRNGEFGEDYLTLYEILVLANDIDLLDRLNIEELDYLINHNTGFVKLMFIELRKNRFKEKSMILSLDKGEKHEI